MDCRLLRPRWIAAHLAVLALGVLFIALGIWQIDRLEERRELNAVAAERFAREPEPLGSVLLDAGANQSDTQYRRVMTTGTFDPAREVLIRSQVYLGSAGFHVVTPLITGQGEAVLVNRGWVPLALDTVPVTEALPPSGEATVLAWVQPSQQRPALGPEDPAEGRLTTLNRIDIGRIQDQVDYSLAPVYLVEIGSQGTELPVPLDPPALTDEGPHLAYAVQWFGFAVVLLAGYFFLVRRRLTTGAQEESGALASPSTIS